MPTARRNTATNPLKMHGETKARTTALADKSRPRGPKARTADTATAQGGSGKRASRDASDNHPSQRGGATIDEPASDPREEPGRRPGAKRPGARPGGRGTATAPSRGGQTRTGRTKGDRQTATEKRDKPAPRRARR